ncbi:isopentenyl-diphosphate Delta-isomerase [Mobilicoccus pelagius]|uniref:Isopentenyl-diphosphate Delta-isomerase n=1 Tax=Mobilicoccus pelagius NBRC 104925 TaxID=1089455 RepID=H5USS6_9MICO|nr:isopentenyl-diphosphate Delta-isomerase [Mobilicoccus pelagius]GAB48784.1 isopentenyl-diphosphate Delta-isomerase [Mobilicoccus pelagius NBRC 104925]
MTPSLPDETATPATPNAVPDEVVLLDETGRPIGTADRTTVHTDDTPLHLAFSFHAVRDGQTLLTRRDVGKRTWPGVWSNTACGHPRAGEAIEDAVRRRVAEELGAPVGELRCVLPEFRYRAVDASGVVENEICPVFVGTIEGEPNPDRTEIMDHAWVDRDAALEAARRTPVLLSPWSVMQFTALAELVD